MISQSAQEYRAELLATLAGQHGHVISVRALHRILGFRSYEALKQSAANGTLTIPLFYIPGRRARHAMAVDVVDWLTERWIASRQSLADQDTNTPQKEDDMPDG